MTGSEIRVRPWAAAFAAALCLASAAGLRAEPSAIRSGKIEDLSRAVSQFQQDLSGGISPEDASARAFALFNEGIPGARIAVKPQFHPWRTLKHLPQAPASVDDLAAASRDALTRAISVPAPDLAQAMDAMGSMQSDGRIAVGDDLPDREMGVYLFNRGSDDPGRIDLNGATPYLAELVGLPLAASTLVHESYHRIERVAGHLRGESVAAEVGAFLAQYNFLKAVYPTGQEIATRWMQLKTIMELRPSPLVAQALGFLGTMHALFSTGGDAEQIRALVKELGYRENAPGRDSSSPISP